MSDSHSSSQFFKSHGIEDSKDEFEQLHLYPNPTSGLLTVEVPSAAEYRLIDATGRLLEAGQWVPGFNSLDLSRYAAGMYHLVTEGLDVRRSTIVKR